MAAARRSARASSRGCGPREDTRNYRPITLLNTDYKVFTRVLAQRMMTAVHQFVDGTQKGFVPDVFIAELTKQLRLIEAHINEEPEDRKGLFIFLDMEKAFDRVSHQYLNEALKALNFGPNFRQHINILYNDHNPQLRRTYVNGYYSDWFETKSGTAQGCPLSPLLFLLIGESSSHET